LLNSPVTPRAFLLKPSSSGFQNVAPKGRVLRGAFISKNYRLTYMSKTYTLINKCIGIGHTMKTKREELLRVFKHNKGILRFSAMLKSGFHRLEIKSLVESGEIEKIGRGIYRLKNAPSFSNPDLVTVALKAPNSVICLVSALYYHKATDEIPRKVDVAILRRPWANKIEYPPVQYFRFSEKAWKAGIETHMIDGHPVKIYSLAKTIADCFKYRNKIGLNIARDALKTAVGEKKVKPTEIMRYAEICRVDKIIRPYLEALL